MKRPPGLWILLSLGVLWISVRDAHAVRATALIFGRSTTTTTTESAESSSASSESSSGDEVSVASTEPSSGASPEGNTTKPTLTGNPQIDYKWDPNLPSALKGYDLSEYPFYERVPDLTGLEFKCDGLHDGFYASIPHKCQVYHHCLFGTRYDFLCANYTAFDQKTFNCQFLNLVDCENSKNFWHRNDDLYQVATTTTQKPLRSLYTPPPEVEGGPFTPSGPGGEGRRPAAGGRRPYRPPRRRPPQVDYYEDEYYDDDYYDERPRSRRKRPRPRPRPAYEDEYEEYADERYEGRRAQGRRRPYRADRDRRRNKGRKKPEYDDEEEAVDELFEDDDFVEAAKKQKTTEERRKQKDEEDQPESRERKRPKDKRRRPDDDVEPEAPRKPPRKGTRRPVEEDYEDELPQSDDSRSYEDQRPRKKKPQPSDEDKDGRPVIKPVSGSIYDRPRLAPRINLPVPKNAADKFSYKALGQGGTTKKPTKTEKEEEEYYDDYEEDLPPKRKKNQRNRPDDIKKEKPRNEIPRNQVASTTKKSKRPEPETEEKVERATSKPKYGGGRKYTTTTRSTTTGKRKPVSEEYEDEDYEIEEKEVKEVTRPVSPFRSRNKQRDRSTTSPSTSTTSTTTTATTTTTTTTTTEAAQKEVMVRIVKRPFLPSRGGNPYSARGLQPIGLKSNDRPTPGVEEYREPSAEDTRALQEVPIEKERFRPSPVLIKIPVRTKYIPPSGEAQEVFDSESSRQQNYKSQEYLKPRPTQKPQRVPERNPLDTNEYDVTLNDALSPTLPNIPIRSFPTGFSNTANDYTYSTYQRPRYVQVEPVISQSNPELVYQAQASVRQPSQPQRYEQFPPNQYSTITGGYRRREAPTGQTQALYSGF